ncbi:MAG: AI-2E family transporter [Methanospirillum sp.]|uniref:AI-2E family transporter n=1 Tax=Methanospirillum sp. TaxID=45200 RepID=UPI0023711D82|nr:AI-2E family transporter [Methanospirillum sp.]MDD1728173.1 AI-2E family transporter [Methanospirillum sp.]
MKNNQYTQSKHVSYIPDFFKDLSGEQRAGILLASVILFLTAFLFWRLAYAAIIAISLAIVLMPAQHYLQRYIGKGYAAITVCLLSLGIIVGFILFLLNTIIVTRVYIFELAQTIGDAIRNYQPGSGSLFGFVLKTIGGVYSQSDSAKMIEDSAPAIIQSLSSFAQNLPGTVIELFITILLLFLLLRNGEEISSQFFSIIPSQMDRYFSILCRVVTDTMYGVYVVNISVAILTFFITLPFFWVLGYGEIVFWAFICAASHLFPFFGPQLITLLLAGYAIAQGDMRGLVLVAAVGYPLISGLQDFWIRPRLLARRVAIHPVLMMIGIFGGMLIMGAIGLIIGPLIIALADAGYDILSEIITEKQSEENTGISV